MRNIKLIIAYDGTCYNGWQDTHTGPSIENSLKTTLEQILQHPVKLQAASRTDAGVHARGQVVNFSTFKDGPGLSRLGTSLNCLLPKDIAVLNVEQVPEAFHPTLDAKGKEYHYYVCYSGYQIPQNRLYSWHYPHELNLPLMQNSANYLIGKHDFSSFCNAKKNEQYAHYEREVSSIEIDEVEEKRLRIVVKGTNFLYKMVRNIAGTLVYIGRGKIGPEDLPEILKQHDRTQSGVTAPAHGLCLHRIFF
jgi:tRNA pseudouridine38-40 synthase